MSRVERVALIVAVVTGVISAIAGVIYIIDRLWFPLFVTIPTDIFLVIFVVSVIIIVSFLLFHLKRWMSIEWIESVQAYIFFPKGTPREKRNLNYHKKHLRHRLIVNHKTKPPKAYYMTPKSYGWKLIKKYPIWVHEIPSHEGYSWDDPNFTKEWCKEQGYELKPWNATKNALLKTE